MDASFFLLLTGAVTLNLVPTFIAAGQRHPYGMQIFLVNVLLGWTLIGWVGALIWAVTPPRDHEKTSQEEANRVTSAAAITVAATVIAAAFLYEVVSEAISDVFSETPKAAPTASATSSSHPAPDPPIPPMPEINIAALAERSRPTTVSTEGALVRHALDRARVIATLSAGTEVDVAGEAGGWNLVVLPAESGQPARTGWMKSSELR